MNGFKTLEISTDVVSRDTAPTPARGGLAPWQVRTLVAHVDANLEDEISVETMAGLVRLSTSHFGRAFKQSFGQSPHAYVVKQRIARAQDLMLESAEPLAQIALAVGLADQSHLSRLFRQMTGETPFAWRRARWTPAGAGIAPEPRHFSEAPDKPDFASVRLDPDQTYSNTMVFKPATRQ